MLRDTVDSGGSSGIQFKQDPVSGILTFWDSTRSMFLGVDREKYEYGIDHKNIRVNIWMMINARIKSLANGNLIPRNCSITCITANSSNLTDCEFEIYANNTLKTSITIINDVYKIDDSLTINLNESDDISVLCKPLNGKLIDYPSLTIEIAWR